MRTDLRGRMRSYWGRPARRPRERLRQRRVRHRQWSSTVFLLAEVTRVLDERAAAQELFALMLPFAGLMTWTSVCSLGPFDLALGHLAATLGRTDEAVWRLRAA